MTVAEEVCAKLRGQAEKQGLMAMVGFEETGDEQIAKVYSAGAEQQYAIADYIEAADALAAAQTSEESVDMFALLLAYNAALSRLREVMG